LGKFLDQTLLGRVRAAAVQDEISRSRRSTRQDAQKRVDLLTRRECEVLNGVVTGQSNKQIAAAMQLSTKTVEVHRAHIMEKVKADSLADLIRLWMVVTGDDDTTEDES
jgi:two-component system response regulator FixJ